MKYRKKPVVVDAYQTDKELDIVTLEGTMHASVGDFIITGVNGETYPCKPDIFHKTYEAADVLVDKGDYSVRQEEFDKLAATFVDFLYKWGCPHTTIIITMEGAEMLNGEVATRFELRD